LLIIGVGTSAILNPGGDMMTEDRVAVSKRALVQRINRKLAERGEKLVAARGSRARADVGAYYIIDVNRNVLLWRHVALEAKGRDLGVLQPWERLEEE
jgi:hypothetical protein